MTQSAFGFSTEPSTGGDFLPIVKYDARSGRFFRIDRIDVGNGNFESNPVDITNNFTAMFDFDNIEVGWIDFPPGSAPSTSLIKLGSGALPVKPSAKHKNGVRVMIKLHPSMGGDKPIREVMGTSKAMLSGLEAAYDLYQKGKAANAGKLPVLGLKDTVAIKTGTGQKTSTNYRPNFELKGWAARGDLQPSLRGASGDPMGGAQQPQQQTQTNGAAQAPQGAPATGGQHAPAPAQQPATFNATDFG